MRCIQNISSGKEANEIKNLCKDDNDILNKQNLIYDLSDFFQSVRLII